MVHFKKHFRGLYADMYYSIKRVLLEIVIFLPGQKPITVMDFSVYAL